MNEPILYIIEHPEHLWPIYYTPETPLSEIRELARIFASTIGDTVKIVEIKKKKRRPDYAKPIRIP